MAVTFSSKILTRTDTSDNWESANPILSRGEIGYDITIKKHKVGDGVSHWTELTYNALQTDLNSRLSYLIGTTEEWSRQISLVSKKGMFYIYSDHGIIETEDEQIIYEAGVKIGDGTTYVVDLPFVTVTQAERDFWNNKVRCYIDAEISAENLIFTTH